MRASCWGSIHRLTRLYRKHAHCWKASSKVSTGLRLYVALYRCLAALLMFLPPRKRARRAQRRHRRANGRSRSIIAQKRRLPYESWTRVHEARLVCIPFATGCSDMICPSGICAFLSCCLDSFVKCVRPSGAGHRPCFQAAGKWKARGRVIGLQSAFLPFEPD